MAPFMKMHRRRWRQATQVQVKLTIRKVMYASSKPGDQTRSFQRSVKLYIFGTICLRIWWLANSLNYKMKYPNWRWTSWSCSGRMWVLSIVYHIYNYWYNYIILYNINFSRKKLMFVVKSSYLYKTLFLISITCQWSALIHLILPELHLLLPETCSPTLDLLSGITSTSTSSCS